MVIDQFPSDEIVKSLKGLIDFYVYRQTGKEIFVARAYPRKTAAYQSERFRMSAQAAHYTMQAYNSLTKTLKRGGNLFHVGLGDYFLDHFRAANQGIAHQQQKPPDVFTSMQIDITTSPPDALIRLFRPHSMSLAINHKRPERVRYIWNTTRLNRGQDCPKRYYLRPTETSFDHLTATGTGWTAWILLEEGNEIEIFSKYPTVVSPQKPWFGPFPFKKFLEYFSTSIV